MSLKDDKQRNIQMELDFSSALTGATRGVAGEETESWVATSGSESPARTDRLTEEVCERENLKAALRQVKGNKGSAGVDGVTVNQLPDYLKQHWPAIREQLLNGTYEPKPERRVEIPKPDGGVRKLGIPTVLDRFIQQAVMQVLQRQWDSTFSDHSYGFRPGRSAHQAVAQAQQYIAAGYAWVMENGLVSPSVEGTPQGGPLSPLLSNLMLDELDRELERRGHRYLRYADDCNIYVGSERAGQRGMEGITRFITHQLKLKVNEAKSAVARPQERKILGFSFSTGPEVKRIIAPKALERFKHRIREVTRRAKGVSMETTIAELAPYLRGWRSYFGFCETPDELMYLTRWVRLRLRAALWRQWKTPRRRRAALLSLGVRPRLANNTAGSGRGPWYLVRAKALSVGLSNAYFKSLGLPTLIDGC